MTPEEQAAHQAADRAGLGPSEEPCAWLSKSALRDRYVRAFLAGTQWRQRQETLTVDDLYFIASVLTDHADERLADDDQPDGTYDAIQCRGIARKASILATAREDP